MNIIIHWYQRKTRGYSDRDVEEAQRKMVEARDSRRSFNLNRYEFAALRASVNRVNQGDPNDD